MIRRTEKWWAALEGAPVELEPDESTREGKRLPGIIVGTVTTAVGDRIVVSERGLPLVIPKRAIRYLQDLREDNAARARWGALGYFARGGDATVSH